EHLIYHATWFTDCVLQTVPIAYNDYLHTGDIRAVRHHYDALKAKLLLPLREANGLISTRTGKQTDELKKAIHLMDKSLNDLVDWPHKGGFGGSVPGGADGLVFTTYKPVVNALRYKASCDVARLAAATGKTADVRQQ